MKHFFAGIPVEFVWLFGSLMGLLAIASSVAAILARRPGDGSKAASRANLVARINAWWVMVGILAVAFLTGPTMTLVLFALASFFALRDGDSLIIFPEGTRGTTAIPAPFRSGLFRLAGEFPAVELIPVHLDNLHRSLPKGTLLPVPVVCTVRFGAPLARIADEAKDAFLARARAAVIALGAPA